MATAAQKKAAAAKRAEADRIAMQKAMEARGAARQTAAAADRTYAQSLEDPITSQYDPRIGANAGFDPERVGVMSGSKGMTATERAEAVAASGGSNTPASSVKDTDAFALIKETFRLYDLEDLFPAIQQLMIDDVGPEQASLLLKTDPRYNAKYIERFAGNDARRKAGLNTLSEAEYIALEDSYSETLKSYGLQGQYGTDRKSRQAAFANIIGNDVSPTEFKTRITTVVDRVQNADPAVKNAMTSFYGIKESDLVNYFLNPKENLVKLQEKVTAAEIGAAATGQSLQTSAAAAEALARFGVTKESAREGYSTIGDILPTATKLGDIYGDKYTQATAEEEVFKGTASAKRKRQQLAMREEAAFSGQSGTLRTGKQQGNTGTF